jgi:hypothetical protein
LSSKKTAGLLLAALLLASCGGSAPAANLTFSGSIQGVFKPEKGDCSNLQGDAGQEDDMHLFIEGRTIRILTKSGDRYEGTGASIDSNGMAHLDADLDSATGKKVHLTGTLSCKTL